jgi:dephospho-CoA kinase
MSKIIFGFVGELGSGKTVVCDYLKEKYGANSYRFSGPLRDVLDRVYLDQSRENMQNLSTIMREQFGQDLLAKIMAHDAEKDSGEIVTVDGVRRFPDIEHLQKLDGFYLVYVTVDSRIRYERIVARGQNPGENKISYEEFLESEKSEADRSITEVGEKADFKIINDGSLEDLYQKIEEVINKLKVSS